MNTERIYTVAKTHGRNPRDINRLLRYRVEITFGDSYFGCPQYEIVTTSSGGTEQSAEPRQAYWGDRSSPIDHVSAIFLGVPAPLSVKNFRIM
mmetsp:Transcript_16891/g.24272  ORF Transcript_16891/g.24272 Transcript_16891/m.24272 type:complete len:93 (+) Transcript_16891:576-854(+)